MKRKRTIEFKDGIYNGELKGDKKHGVGTLTYKNGDVYSGYWKDDLRTGVGEFSSLQRISIQEFSLTYQVWVVLQANG